MTAYRGLRRRNPAVVERLEKIRLFHSMGMSTKEMSRVLDLAQDTIGHYIREMGLPPIGKREASTIRSIITLKECETCSFSDCVWDGVSTLCPEQRKRKGETN